MKKIIPALALLLISAVVMTTASYAWFAMNTSVKASGMKVSASTDNAYLIISQGTTLSGNEKEATSTLDYKLKPVKPVVNLSSSNIETLGSWGTASSEDPNDAMVNAQVTALSTGTLIGDGNYLLKESFKVGIVANSGTVANNLRMKDITITGTENGTTVVVVCGTNIYTYIASASGMTDVLANKDLVTTDGVQIDVYIYIDGSNANVKTANAASLGGSVTLNFTIDP